jgi:hypothetical protein
LALLIPAAKNCARVFSEKVFVVDGMIWNGELIEAKFFLSLTDALKVSIL